METKFTEVFTIWLPENLLGTDNKAESPCSRDLRSCSRQGWKEAGNIRMGVEVDIKHQVVTDCLGHHGQGACTAGLSHGSTVDRSVLDNSDEKCQPKGGYLENDLPAGPAHSCLLTFPIHTKQASQPMILVLWRTG